MKILVIVPSLVSYPFLRDMCFELVKLGHLVHLAAHWKDLGRFQKDSDSIVFHSIELPRGMNPIAHIKAMNQLNSLVREIKPDIIDAHFSAAAFTAALAKRKYWPPVIATVQGLRFPIATGIQKYILRYAECWSAKKLDKMIVLTDDDLLALKKAGVVNRHKQSAYGFGCDLNKFDRLKFTEMAKQKTAEEINKQENEIIFSFIGRFVAFKGFHIVARAFVEAHLKCPSIKLLICGDFDEYHPSGLSEFEVAGLRAHAAVVFKEWTDEVGKYLSVTDVVVFPSEREGVPVILMEALSMGIPVITCDSRGCREVMNEGAHGVVLRSRTAEELTKALLEVSGNSVLRAKYSSSALKFRRNFDRQWFSSEHIELLQSVYSGKKA